MLDINISIVNGSPRPQGSTAKTLQLMKFHLEQKSDVTVDYIDLSDYEITLCQGCMYCYKTGECVIGTDKIEELSARIKSSDAVIIGSPTFGSNVSSHLKALIDRGHFIVEQSLTGKYGFSVATYQIAEGRVALNIIKKFFLVSGASRKGSLLVKTDLSSDPTATKNLHPKISRKMERFYQAVKKKSRKSLFERFFVDIILLPIIWKPLFLREKESYEGVFRLWKEKGIISDQ